MTRKELDFLYINDKKGFEEYKERVCAITAALFKVVVGGVEVPYRLTGGQKDIFFNIVTRWRPRMIAITPTRYGKSFTIAAAIVVRITTHEKEKWTVVAPTMVKSRIIMKNCIDFLLGSPVLSKMIPVKFNNKNDQLKHEKSRERITLYNGSEVKILSADADSKVGGGRKLMGHGCFDYNEKILTEDGYLKIGDVVKNKVDIKIYTYNESTGDIELKKIKQYMENPILHRYMMEIEDSNGDKIVCTNDHPIFVSGKGWIRADELECGDELININEKNYVIEL